MHKTQIMHSSDSLIAEFFRCCQEYKNLSIAVAWCGTPDKTLPYKYLESFKGTIKAIVGIAFHHTHPDAIEWFIGIGADIRVFKDNANIFHPKVYLFTDQKRFALFIGSSNLTYGGFYTNCETNCLIEGKVLDGKDDDIKSLEQTIKKWRTPELSFKPSPNWLSSYRKQYKQIAAKQKKQRIHTPPKAEDEIPISSWLQNADWDIYYRKVIEGLRQHEDDGRGYHHVLDTAANEIPIPWEKSYFKDISKRRIIGGFPREQFGWLGHVGSSGYFRGLLKNGPPDHWAVIVKAINEIAGFTKPIPWSQMKSCLDSLISLGPSMKVWGRVICIIRPELYCTVSSNSVRRQLSKLIGVPQNRFYDADGYIQLIKLIHSSPWHNADEPENSAQAAIWRRRAAFIDVVLTN